MSNYPPGVTGNEYEIAGPDYERDEERECTMQDAVIRVVNHESYDVYVAQIERMLVTDETPDPAALLRYLQGVKDSVMKLDVEYCPFEGYVTVQGYGGMEWWDCPVCGHRHEEDMRP